jgi:hypothetical protein
MFPTSNPLEGPAPFGAGGLIPVAVGAGAGGSVGVEGLAGLFGLLGISILLSQDETGDGGGETSDSTSSSSGSVGGGHEPDDDDDGPSVSSLPDLSGKSLADAEKNMLDRGFSFKNETKGGYRRYTHPDGSTVWIRPNGEVQRIGPKIDPGPNLPNYSKRYGPDGQLTGDHSTKEFVKR